MAILPFSPCGRRRIHARFKRSSTKHPPGQPAPDQAHSGPLRRSASIDMGLRQSQFARRAQRGAPIRFIPICGPRHAGGRRPAFDPNGVIPSARASGPGMASGPRMVNGPGVRTGPGRGCPPSPGPERAVHRPSISERGSMARTARPRSAVDAEPAREGARPSSGKNPNSGGVFQNHEIRSPPPLIIIRWESLDFPRSLIIRKSPDAANLAILAERSQFPRPRPIDESRDIGRTKPISAPRGNGAKGCWN